MRQPAIGTTGEPGGRGRPALAVSRSRISWSCAAETTVAGASSASSQRGVAMLPMVVLMAFPFLGIVLFFVLPPGLAVPLYILGFGLSILVNWLMMRAMRSPVQTGRQGMVGAPARVLSWGDESGYVSCHGEVWRARSVNRSPLTAGTQLEVLGIQTGEDMVLEVRAITQPEADVGSGSHVHPG